MYKYPQHICVIFTIIETCITGYINMLNETSTHTLRESLNIRRMYHTENGSFRIFEISGNLLTLIFEIYICTLLLDV
jgi:hypothetical protein